MIPKWKSNLAVLLRFRSTTSIYIKLCRESSSKWLEVMQNKVSKSKHFLSDLISIQQPLSYHLRRNDNARLLERPSVKTKKTLGDRAFQLAAPFLWNKLPRSLPKAMNLESFKTLIKTFLFKESFQLS